MPVIRQIQSIDESTSTEYLYDLENRSITLSATSGTLTDDQLAILQASEDNYIKYSDGRLFKFVSNANSKLYYQRLTATDNVNQYFEITISTKAYKLTTTALATQSWTNTQIQTAIGDAIAASY